MDLLAAVKLYDKISKKEHMQDAQSNTSTQPQQATFFSYLLSLAITVIAIYLSWTCNSATGMDPVLKVGYAFVAGMFGVVYVVCYMIFRAGNCAGCPPPPVPMPVVKGI